MMVKWNIKAATNLLWSRTGRCTQVLVILVLTIPPNQLKMVGGTTRKQRTLVKAVIVVKRNISSWKAKCAPDISESTR